MSSVGWCPSCASCTWAFYCPLCPPFVGSATFSALRDIHLLDLTTTANQALSNTWCTILKTKGQNMLQMPSLADKASLTQNMNIMHLKTKVSDNTHGTQ